MYHSTSAWWLRLMCCMCQKLMRVRLQMITRDCTSCLSALQPEGDGKYIWPDGSMYEGGWKASCVLPAFENTDVFCHGRCPLTLRNPKGARAGDMCSLSCCWRCWQQRWHGSAAVPRATVPLCCRLALAARSCSCHTHAAGQAVQCCLCPSLAQLAGARHCHHPGRAWQSCAVP